MAFVRWLDLGLLALALPLFVAAGLPGLGYAAIAVAWLAQRAIELVAERHAAGALARGDRRSALGAVAAATLGRVWLVALTVLLVGVLSEREAGLAAAVLAAVLVTVHLGTRFIVRALSPGEGP